MIFERFQTKPFSSRSCDIFQWESINTVDSERLKSDWYGNFLRHTIFSAASTSSQVNGWEKEIIRLMEFQVWVKNDELSIFSSSPSSANQTFEEFDKKKILRIIKFQLLILIPPYLCKLKYERNTKKEKWQISILDFDPQLCQLHHWSHFSAGGGKVSNFEFKSKVAEKRL